MWASRRVPAGLVALAVLVVAGALLYDIAAVRAGRPAMAWRRTVAGELARRRLDDVWVLTGAAVAAFAGLWLIALAVTPGLRALLPLRTPGRPLRAAVDRSTAAWLVRDRTVAVAGVRAARVRVGRRRIRVRADAHFRELPRVRADVTAALARTVGVLGGVPRPAVRVRVRRAKRG
nr:DUF6286 domain-containing protein [Streptomyces sp. SID5468]